MKFNIEKDKYLNTWIVWEVHKNYSIDRLHVKTRKECKKWLSTL